MNHLATKKRQQYQNFMRTKDKNNQLKFKALCNKLQKLIRRTKGDVISAIKKCRWSEKLEIFF